MILSALFTQNQADAAAVETLLTVCDQDFVPSLSSRVSLAEYALKIIAKATRFEAWDGQKLVGLVAVYCNEITRTAFVTNVSVDQRFRRGGIAGRLMDACIVYCGNFGMKKIELQVHNDSVAAISLYKRHGFEFGNRAGDEIQMVRVFSEAPNDSMLPDDRGSKS